MPLWRRSSLVLMNKCKTGYAEKYHELGDCCCDMLLPEDRTCGDCKHFEKCDSWGFTTGADSVICDFSPSKFNTSIVSVLELVDRYATWED